GATLSQVLERLETRVPLPTIRSFASVVSVVQETGGNLAKALLTLAETLRQEIAFQGKVAAMTAQGKLSGYVVSATPFLILGALSVAAPDLIRPLFASALGWVMLLVVGAMVAVGTFWIQKIVSIEI